MSIIRRHTYSENKITAQCRDDDCVWVAFLGSSDSCTLQKRSQFNPAVKYYDITITASEITRIKVLGNYIYCSLDGDTNIGLRMGKSDPSGNYNYITIPSGVTEKAVDVTINSDETFWYLLTPGVISGEYAKVIVVNDTAFSETVTLNESGINIRNASSMTIDASDNVWIVTDTDPISLIRFYDSGGYIFSETELT